MDDEDRVYDIFSMYTYRLSITGVRYEKVISCFIVDFELELRTY